MSSTRDFIEKDYYAALGVAKDADAAAIKKAYRQLARELHPDKNPGNTQAETRFKEVSVPTATTVLRPGYRRGDRVLRTAMVAVTDPEGPVPAAEAPATESGAPASD